MRHARKPPEDIPALPLRRLPSADQVDVKMCLRSPYNFLINCHAIYQIYGEIVVYRGIIAPGQDRSAILGEIVTPTGSVSETRTL